MEERVRKVTRGLVWQQLISRLLPALDEITRESRQVSDVSNRWIVWVLHDTNNTSIFQIVLIVSSWWLRLISRWFRSFEDVREAKTSARNEWSERVNDDERRVRVKGDNSQSIILTARKHRVYQSQERGIPRLYHYRRRWKRETG